MLLGRLLGVRRLDAALLSKRLIETVMCGFHVDTIAVKCPPVIAPSVSV